MPGFTAEDLGVFGNACSGAGPTSIAVVGDTVYFAADGRLWNKPPRSALTSGTGNVQPWGLATVGSRLYATQPHCNEPVTNDPVQGSNCNVVEVNPSTVREVREVSTLCGFALAVDPNGALTVAGRDGAVSSVPVSGGSPTTLFQLSADNPAVSLAWSGDRLYMVRRNGAAMVWRRGASAPSAFGTGTVKSLANADGVNMRGSVLTAVSSGVKAVAVDQGAPAGDVATSSGGAVLVLAAPAGIYVAQSNQLHLLRGRYTPPGAPPPPPPPTTPPPTAPRVPPTSIVQSAAPPPPVQAPPPPPPPAPPAPPLATAAQVVAQPSAVANPAIVPGESEREAAMRLAATGLPRRLAPHVLWILLALAVCGGGLGAGMALRRSDAGRYAWADND